MSQSELREKIRTKIFEVSGTDPEIKPKDREILDGIMVAIDEYVREESEKDDPETWRNLKEGDRVRVRPPPPDDGIARAWLTPDLREGWKLDARIGQTGTLDKDDGDGIPWVRWDNPEGIATCIHQFKLEKIDDEH